MNGAVEEGKVSPEKLAIEEQSHHFNVFLHHSDFHHFDVF